ncbi:MAG: DUF3798 domain-containing protein [Anaerofustis stercorihominis]|nr:DUF3798 domain-containing protein [Anaerofustis stercorihominis]
MKKLIAMLLAVMMLFSFAACGGDDDDAASKDYKIAILTGTTSQGEEEYQGAQRIKNELNAIYGEDFIITATYPDNFTTETEQTISTVKELCSKPEVKALVFVQAVQGATAAIKAVKETRDDILFICGVPGESPAVISDVADICFQSDEVKMGTTIIQQAHKQGAKTFVHISFARHLGMETIARRRDLFQSTCKELGIEYVEATAPDPTGDAGVTGAQQWIIENVPQYVKQYGVDTAFFSTNCSMQEPLIRTVAEQKAIYPIQCCPSPYHAYPSAFGIDVTGHEGDVAWMLDAITAKVKEYGNSGRMSTWSAPVNMLMVEAGVQYAIKYLDGETEGKLDREVLDAIIVDIAGEGAEISEYQDTNLGALANYLVLACPFYDF